MQSGEQLKPAVVTKECSACGQSYPLHSFAAAPSHVCPKRPLEENSDGTATESPDIDTLLIGATIAERYRIEEVIDKGGMGIVFRGRHTVLHSAVAIKILHQRKQVTNLQRFHREALLSSKLRHNNIVYIQDFGLLPDGLPYLVMELVTGATLASAVERGALDPLRACEIAVQIARGMQVVHSAGIIHRDLKPENIILTAGRGEDLLKIIDFGVAKEVATPADPQAKESAATTSATGREGDAPVGLTRAGAFIGSPRYISPEQVQGDAVDPRSDQYSLGCILYQLLTGSVPFESKASVDLLAMHLCAPVQPPRQRRPGLRISDALEAIVLRMLSKTKEERFPSMQALEETLAREVELLRVARGLSVQVRADTAAWLSGHLPAGLARRGRGFLVVATLAIVVVIAGSGFLLYRVFGLRSEISTEEVERARRQAIETLLQLAKPQKDAPPAPLRAAALRALSQSHDSTHRQFLETALRDGDLAVQGGAIEALGALGERAAIPALATFLRDSSAAASKLAVARALDNLGEPLGLSFLERAVLSPDEELRLGAALALCMRGGRAVQSTLSKLLDEGKLPDAARQTINACLRKDTTPEARAQLRAQLTGGGSLVSQMNAAARLLQVGDASGPEFLRGLLRRSDDQQLIAARLLAPLADNDSAIVFRKTLSKSGVSESARQLASEGLGLCGGLEDLRVLSAQLAADAPAAARIAAAKSILELSAKHPKLLSQQTLAWIEGSLSDPSELRRQAAVDALSQDPEHDVVPVLIGLLGDRYSIVRQHAVRALGRRATAAAMEPLRRSLADSDPAVRIEAIRAMRRTASALSRTPQAALDRLRQELQEIIKTGSAVEQAVARSQILALGGTEQLAELSALRSSKVVEQRLSVVTENREQAEVLREYVKDSDWSVRWSAASGLAAKGDRGALQVLTEAVQRRGPESVSAFLWLRHLGAGDGAEPETDKLLGTEDSSQRLQLLEATAGLPDELVAPVLARAARDLEPLVRLMVVTLLGERLSTTAPSPLLSTLRGLARDDNAMVRERARAIFVRLTHVAGSESARPLNWTIPQPRPPFLPPGQEVAETGEDAGQTGARVTGPTVTLALSAKKDVWFRVDKKSWQRADHATLSLASGAHTLTTLDGAKSLELTGPQKLEIEESEIEKLVEKGLISIKKKDLRPAQRALERVLALCARDRKIEQPCNALSYDLSIELATVYEGQGMWVEAMKEYQRLSTSGDDKHSPERKAAVAAGIQRVGARVGQVIVLDKTKKGCSERTLWLPPGSHTVTQGSAKYPVEVRLRQVVRVGKCP